MNAPEARTLAKAINRRLRRTKAFYGGGPWGLDFATFQATYPQMCQAFNQAAEILTGKPGRYIPRL